MSVLERTAWWSSTDAARAAGISYRQLDYWCRSGVIVPAGTTDLHDNPVEVTWAATPGTGRARRFTARQVAILRACGRLARLCADTPALAALVAVCEHVELPVTVAVDVDGSAHLAPFDLEQIRACWAVTIG